MEPSFQIVSAPDGRLTDIELKINGKVFECERSLLILASAYFETMFEADFTEKFMDTVELREIDDSAFTEIMNFIYGQPVNVTPSNVLSLLRASDFLQLRSVYIENKCYSHLECHITPLPNACELILFSHATKKERFTRLLVNHIKEYINYFVSDDAILEFPFELLRDVLPVSYKEYDGEDHRPLYVTGNATLKLIMSWINHCRKERSQYRKELMGYLLSTDISKDYALALLMESEKFMDALATGDSGSVDLFASPNKLVYPAYSDTQFATGTTLLMAIYPFSSLKANFSEHSAPFQVNGVAWTLTAKHVNKNVLFSLRSNKGFSERCFFDVCLTLVSQKEGVADISIQLRDRLNLDGKIIISFPSVTRFDFDYLSQEENGFIKNDLVIVKGRVSI